MKSFIPLLALAGMTAHAAAPQTLLEMSSAKIEIEPEATAIVFIDYQNEYRTGALPLNDIDAVIKESQGLLQWARDKKVPVVHVFHQGAKGGLFDVTAKRGEAISEMAPAKGEKIVAKSYPNAFQGTDLAAFLKKNGRTSVVFAGLMTHMCVEASVRAAHEQGFKAAIVASATTTRDLRSPYGETLKAETVKRASLATISDLVGAVVRDADELESLFSR